MGKAARRATCAALAAVACAALLAGCTQEDRAAATPGPTATTTVAPPEAAALADRYRAAGGDADVYGIESVFIRESHPPYVVVRTHNPDTDDALFKKQAASIASFLTKEGELPSGTPYLMDVYGPDGRLLHRWDTTP
ncbi:hypothetical protein [Streptomyces sp. NPDC091371]|uniref:hypothetical protein n=1 Tax=Streptomyces sp. NPDC091371 TaxID=3155303 RepID=UPI003438684A